VSHPGLDDLLLGGLAAGAMVGIVSSSRAGMVGRLLIGCGAVLFLPPLSLIVLLTTWPIVVTVLGAAFIAFSLSRGVARLLPGDYE
jgi:hypothetical protein